jgi:TRAP-type C4-dicarboxylate transport system permease small subunit
MLFDKGPKYFSYVWIYALFPLIGAVLAVAFHEFVFKKTQEVVNEDDGGHDEDEHLIEK